MKGRIPFNLYCCIDEEVNFEYNFNQSMINKCVKPSNMWSRQCFDFSNQILSFGTWKSCDTLLCPTMETQRSTLEHMHKQGNSCIVLFRVEDL
mmetsp:Transcript_21489/g.32870  ORF Transcript_21489/g.32870 Transcript_21489/m.32870 type:complete len:93 (-) Transcript_21489:35-313(-)